MMKNKPSPEQLVDGIKQGNKLVLSRAISLSESSLDSDRELAFAVLKQLLPLTGNSIRIAVTGPPGAGKSTFIEAIGKKFTAEGVKVAVISVDPSSPLSGGSILGDKTRMDELSRDPLAFIRPFSAAGHLGGISFSTREAILFCEAAGYNIVLVETVGVGQSETEAVEASDLFFLLIHTGAGDELQAMKKGIMEMPDAVIINKADKQNIAASNQLAQDLKLSFHALNKDSVKIFQVSSAEKRGLDEIVAYINEVKVNSRNHIEQKRKAQKVRWLYALLQQKLWKSFISDPDISKELGKAEGLVTEVGVLPEEIAEKILKKFKVK